MQFWESVQFRISNNELEYRTLIIHESEHYRENGSSDIKLYIGKNPYTEWQPVPKAETNET